MILNYGYFDTGGSLMSQNQTLEKILDAVFRMAVRKRVNKRRGKGKNMPRYNG
ncbi:MAG: hypothetical protein ACLSDJ_08775 [Butyricimonas faecihominis]